MDSIKQMYYANIRKQIILNAQLFNDLDYEAKVTSLQRETYKLVSTKNIQEKEITFITKTTDMEIIVRSKKLIDTDRCTTLEFYRAIELMNKENKVKK